MSDQPGMITLQTASGNTIKIEPAQVEVSVLGTLIKIDASGVTVQTAGILNVNCSVANVTASSIMNVNAPVANFSGILRANLVQTLAVVSPVYTPGIGNLFGL